MSLVLCLMILASGEIITPPLEGSVQATSMTVDQEHLYLTWWHKKDQGATLQFTVFDGQDWSAVRDIRHVSKPFINWTDKPRMIAKDDFLVVVWPEMIGEGLYAYGLRYATSTDGGTSWKKPDWLHEDRSPQEHGFTSLVHRGDEIQALWLDGNALSGDGDDRADDAKSSHDDHGHSGGRMELRTRSITPQGLGPEYVVDDAVCECCHTQLIWTGDAFLAVYRNQTKGQIRDIYARRFKNDLLGPEHAVHHDGWEIHGCPVNGPALARQDEAIAVAWFTGADGGAAKLATSFDQGRSFGEPHSLGDQVLGYVGLTFAPKTSSQARQTFVATWLETDDDSQTLLYAQGFQIHKMKVKSLQSPQQLNITQSPRQMSTPEIVTFNDAAYILYVQPVAKQEQGKLVIHKLPFAHFEKPLP